MLGVVVYLTRTNINPLDIPNGLFSHIIPPKNLIITHNHRKTFTEKFSVGSYPLGQIPTLGGVMLGGLSHAPFEIPP